MASNQTPAHHTAAFDHDGFAALCAAFVNDVTNETIASQLISQFHFAAIRGYGDAVYQAMEPLVKHTAFQHLLDLFEYHGDIMVVQDAQGKPMQATLMALPIVILSKTVPTLRLDKHTLDQLTYSFREHGFLPEEATIAVLPHLQTVEDLFEDPVSRKQFLYALLNHVTDVEHEPIPSLDISDRDTFLTGTPGLHLRYLTLAIVGLDDKQLATTFSGDSERVDAWSEDVASLLSPEPAYWMDVSPPCMYNFAQENGVFAYQDKAALVFLQRATAQHPTCPPAACQLTYEITVPEDRSSLDLFVIYAHQGQRLDAHVFRFPIVDEAGLAELIADFVELMTDTARDEGITQIECVDQSSSAGH